MLIDYWIQALSFQNQNQSSTVRNIQFNNKLNCKLDEDSRNEALSNDISKAAKSFRKFRSKLFNKMKNKIGDSEAPQSSKNPRSSSIVDEINVRSASKEDKVHSTRHYKRHVSVDKHASQSIIKVKDVGSD